MSGKEYVLLKRGLYWRPGSFGYTESILEAGLFSEEESAQAVERGRFNPPELQVTRMELGEALELAATSARAAAADLDRYADQVDQRREPAGRKQ